MGTLGFGIVGTGAIAQFHAEAVAASQGGKLVAVADRTLPKAQSFAKACALPSLRLATPTSTPPCAAATARA